MARVRTALACALLLAGGAVPVGGQPVLEPDDPAAFLARLAGEWTVVSEAIPGPGQEPVRSDSREAARLIGDRWLVAEGSGTARGRAFTSILTVGYDPHRKRFVATWIDSMQTHLWLYEGTLDESGTVLTLDTEGPILGDPSRTTRYRETIEIVAANHKRMTSRILGPNGEWFEFARSDYRRSP
jgi:hypothetical protein